MKNYDTLIKSLNEFAHDIDPYTAMDEIDTENRQLLDNDPASLLSGLLGINKNVDEEYEIETANRAGILYDSVVEYVTSTWRA